MLHSVSNAGCFLPASRVMFAALQTDELLQNTVKTEISC